MKNRISVDTSRGFDVLALCEEILEAEKEKENKKPKTEWKLVKVASFPTYEEAWAFVHKRRDGIVRYWVSSDFPAA